MIDHLCVYIIHTSNKKPRKTTKKIWYSHRKSVHSTQKMSFRPSQNSLNNSSTLAPPPSPPPCFLLETGLIAGSTSGGLKAIILAEAGSIWCLTLSPVILTTALEWVEWPQKLFRDHYLPCWGLNSRPLDLKSHSLPTALLRPAATLKT